MRSKRLIATIAAAACWIASAATGYAGWGMGRGGDSLKLAFARAKENAAHVTLRLNPESLGAQVPADVRAWLRANKEALAADITQTPHNWEDAPAGQPTCAWTNLDPAAQILFSYDKCRTGMDIAGGDAHSSIPSFEDAGLLLVHESVHHLHVADEAFADAVALAVYDAFRRGLDVWSAAAELPEAKYRHASALGDGKAYVFGGLRTPTGGASNTGYAFDLSDGTWSALPTGGAPARVDPILLFTGAKLIVWGGYVLEGGVNRGWQNSGAMLDLVGGGDWKPITGAAGEAVLKDGTLDAPYQSALWTGSEMIVYGGPSLGAKFTGGIFNPEKPEGQQWRALTTTGAPVDAGVKFHAAVWAEDRMIVFGGKTTANYYSDVTMAFVKDHWEVASGDGAPTPRLIASAVFTGKSVVVFGGLESSANVSLGSGAVLDPKALQWTHNFKSESVPARAYHSAVWDGSEMLVYGGKPPRASSVLGSVAAFNPVTKAWRVVEIPNAAAAPRARAYHAAVWTGSYLLITGGYGDIGSGVINADTAKFFP